MFVEHILTDSIRPDSSFSGMYLMHSFGMLHTLHQTWCLSTVQTMRKTFSALKKCSLTPIPSTNSTSVRLCLSQETADLNIFKSSSTLSFRTHSESPCMTSGSQRAILRYSLSPCMLVLSPSLRASLHQYLFHSVSTQTLLGDQVDRGHLDFYEVIIPYLSNGSLQVRTALTPWDTLQLIATPPISAASWG